MYRLVFTPTLSIKNGFFVGGGVENNLNIFGITAPGFVYEDRISLGILRHEEASIEFFDGTLPADWPRHPLQYLEPDDQHLLLVYRFNWTGPVVAKY